MRDIEKILKEFVSELEKAKKKRTLGGYSLIGALAVSARGKPRATHDIDFLVSAERDFFEEEISRIGRSLGYTVKILKGGITDPLRGMARIYDKDGTELIDLIPVFWRWQEEVVKGAEYITALGLALPVARTEDLIVLKLKAGGPQDLIDAEELLKVAHLRGDIDKAHLFNLAKRARIDRNLKKLLSKLKISL